jgi:hypothetical protein
MREYNVVILGPQGAGKTVYLASLAYKLSSAGSTGYYLSTPQHEENQLSNIFTTISGGNDWPRPTLIGGTTEWHFDVIVKPNLTTNYKALSIIYYDYAGGRITSEEDEELGIETQKIIKSADVLIGLLDGEELYKEIYLGEGDPKFWTRDVRSLCKIMTDYNGTSIHFVVSKWDLFPKGEKEGDAALQKIKEQLLMKSDQFKDLIDLRSQSNAATRLIPVSSVGYDYAELKNDEMVIKPGVLPKPLYVEVPFACILPDLIETEAREVLAEAEATAQRLEGEIRAKLSWWDIFTGSVGATIRRMNHGVENSILTMMAEKAEHASKMKIMEADEMTQQNRAEAMRLRASVDSEKSAIEFVLRSMMNTKIELENRFPSSLISSE